MGEGTFPMYDIYVYMILKAKLAFTSTELGQYMPDFIYSLIIFSGVIHDVPWKENNYLDEILV